MTRSQRNKKNQSKNTVSKQFKEEVSVISEEN
jgi:hypothetical protein